MSTMESKAVFPGFAISVTQEVVEMTTGPRHELDPKWSHTDAAGHVHTSLEPLELVVIGRYWCETCFDHHEDIEWRCRQCGAVVEPVYRWVAGDAWRSFKPGISSVKLTLENGRVFLLRPDEMPTMNARGEIQEQDAWIERVTAREPDDVQLAWVGAMTS